MANHYWKQVRAYDNQIKIIAGHFTVYSGSQGVLGGSTVGAGCTGSEALIQHVRRTSDGLYQFRLKDTYTEIQSKVFNEEVTGSGTQEFRLVVTGSSTTTNGFTDIGFKYVRTSGSATLPISQSLGAIMSPFSDHVVNYNIIVKNSGV